MLPAPFGPPRGLLISGSPAHTTPATFAATRAHRRRAAPSAHLRLVFATNHRGSRKPGPPSYGRVPGAAKMRLRVPMRMRAPSQVWRRRASGTGGLLNARRIALYGALGRRSCREPPVLGRLVAWRAARGPWRTPSADLRRRQSSRIPGAQSIRYRRSQRRKHPIGARHHHPPQSIPRLDVDSSGSPSRPASGISQIAGSTTSPSLTIPRLRF